jgi:cytochrome c oxidase subunit 2
MMPLPPSRPSSRRGRSGAAAPRGDHRAGSLALALVLSGALALTGACAGGDSGPVLGAEAAHGRQVAKDRGCTSCHTADGSRSEGPTWKGLAGSTVKLADGSTVVADDAYLARSIQDPRAQVVQGFRTPMPAQSGLTDADVAALTAYLKALRD